MRVLAIDPSSRVIGFALFDNGKLIDYWQKAFKLNNIRDRLDSIDVYMHDYVGDLNVEINKVVIEEIPHHTNVNTTKVLAKVQYIVESWFDKDKVEFVRPSVWRKDRIFAKQRKEIKQEAMTYVKDKYSLDVSEDTAEAIIIGEWYNG